MRAVRSEVVELSAPGACHADSLHQPRFARARSKCNDVSLVPALAVGVHEMKRTLYIIHYCWVRGMFVSMYNGSSGCA